MGVKWKQPQQLQNESGGRGGGTSEAPPRLLRQYTKRKFVGLSHPELFNDRQILLPEDAREDTLPAKHLLSHRVTDPPKHQSKIKQLTWVASILACPHVYMAGWQPRGERVAWVGGERE